MAASHAAAPWHDCVAQFFFEDAAQRNRLPTRRARGAAADLLWCAGSKPVWSRPIISAAAGRQPWNPGISRRSQRS